MCRSVLLLLGVGLIWAQGQNRNDLWVTVGAGAAAGRPTLCTPPLTTSNVRSRGHVYICVGTGCTNSFTVDYCTSTDTWTAVGGGVATATSPLVVTGADVACPTCATATSSSSGQAAIFDAALNIIGDPMWTRTAVGQYKVKNTTATTGQTIFRIDAGAGQGTPPFRFYKDNGDSSFVLTQYGEVCMGDGAVSVSGAGCTAAQLFLGNGPIITNNSGYFGFVNNASALAAAANPKIAFVSAGLVEINNGTALTQTSTGLRAGPLGNMLGVHKYTITKTAGNWVLTGTGAASSQAAAAALTQEITVFALPARSYVAEGQVVKTTTACAGTTTLQMTNLGVTGETDKYGTYTYDLKAAVTDTNFERLSGEPSGPPNTYATINMIVTLVSTVQNISSVTDGCAFELQVSYAVMP